MFRTSDHKKGCRCPDCMQNLMEDREAEKKAKERTEDLERIFKICRDGRDPEGLLSRAPLEDLEAFWRGNSPLLVAVANANLHAAATLLARGVSPNTREDYPTACIGCTPVITSMSPSTWSIFKDNAPSPAEVCTMLELLTAWCDDDDDVRLSRHRFHLRDPLNLAMRAKANAPILRAIVKSRHLVIRSSDYRNAAWSAIMNDMNGHLLALLEFPGFSTRELQSFLSCAIKLGLLKPVSTLLNDPRTTFVKVDHHDCGSHVGEYHGPDELFEYHNNVAEPWVDVAMMGDHRDIEPIILCLRSSPTKSPEQRIIAQKQLKILINHPKFYSVLHEPNCACRLFRLAVTLKDSFLLQVLLDQPKIGLSGRGSYTALKLALRARRSLNATLLLNSSKTELNHVMNRAAQELTPWDRPLLLEAVANGDRALVEGLLFAGADPNATHWCKKWGRKDAFGVNLIRCCKVSKASGFIKVVAMAKKLMKKGCLARLAPGTLGAVAAMGPAFSGLGQVFRATLGELGTMAGSAPRLMALSRVAIHEQMGRARSSGFSALGVLELTREVELPPKAVKYLQFKKKEISEHVHFNST